MQAFAKIASVEQLVSNDVVWGFSLLAPMNMTLVLT